ncbi:DUF222 domain-containing protein [uncultured Microbacterium sp.]|uniref:HNH endonuclease signature motif containing protein n=1 Tax=uncultured Microbacterium sp. TaxID=191216 RepID=UPI0028DBD688|nr:DUF222 domain-containing protein [uncultured Microbacterium sp.]
MSGAPTPPLDLDERRRLVDAWVDVRRQIARLEAEASALLGERLRAHDEDIAEHPHHRDAIHRSMVAEYAAAGRLSQGAIEFAFADAMVVGRDLPAVSQAFQRGDITAAHVHEIARCAAVVVEAIRNARADASTLGLYENAVLVVAESETATRTRMHARRLAAALVGESVSERHRRAADERGVSVKSLDDGLALLTAVLPEALAFAVRDRLTTMAREIIATRDDREPAWMPHPLLDRADTSPDQWILPEHVPWDDAAAAGLDDAIFGGSTFTTDPLRAADTVTASGPVTASAPFTPTQIDAVAVDDVEHRAGDTRTLDQVRADLLADMLLAGAPSACHGTGLDSIQARVQVTVAATTLAGLDDRLAELDGHGPIDADTARALAAGATGWSRLFLDADGMVTETDAYTPTENMRRFLRARDQHCRFPGCRTPVHRCDVDHTHEHSRGGRTRLDNLSHLCRAHHALKHPDVHGAHRWSARSLPDGTIEWTSPLGRTYSDRASRRVMFV